MNKKIIRLFACISILFLPLTVIAEEVDYSINNYEEVDISSEPTLPEQTLENSKIYINEETNYKAVIEDDANLLTENEKEKLLDEITPLTEKGHIIFKTISSNLGTAESYAENYYHNNYAKESGTVFLIDMDNRIIYIFSDGENYKTITSYKGEIITDNVYKYAKNGEYYECASQAFSQIKALLQGNKINQPMKYLCNAILSITLAFLIMYLIVLKSLKIKKSTIKEIGKSTKSSITIGSITATETGTHRVYSPISDNSSSGSHSSGGGGGFSGGGSSGGGGGHGF